MYLRTVFLKTVFTFTLTCCCSSSNKEWLENDVFSTLRDSCKPRSCSEVDADQVGARPPCDCDEACSRYGTCCFDSPYATSTVTKSFSKREECSKVHGSTFSAFIVSHCNPHWRGNRVFWRLCEGITQNDRDPLAKIPVTNPFSNITYKNYFCSVCNFDHRGGVLWNVLLTVKPTKQIDVSPADRDNILHRLQFLADRNSWGVWQTYNDSSTEFLPIEISADMPTTVIPLVKSCDATITEPRCAPTWNDAAVKIMCQSYLSPIKVPLAEADVKFRNPHCAVCNYVSSFETASCIDVPLGAFAPSLSFTLLLDVNPSDGDKVGQSNSCAKNEVTDPFFKKCRALVCALPGYIVTNGRCVKT